MNRIVPGDWDQGGSLQFDAKNGARAGNSLAMVRDSGVKLQLENKGLNRKSSNVLKSEGDTCSLNEREVSEGCGSSSSGNLRAEARSQSSPALHFEGGVSQIDDGSASHVKPASVEDS